MEHNAFYNDMRIKLINERISKVKEMYLNESCTEEDMIRLHKEAIEEIRQIKEEYNDNSIKTNDIK